MKKNLRIVSAAAAALLAVAPVAASAVSVNAANANTNITINGNNGAAATTGNINVTSNLIATTTPNRTTINNVTGEVTTDVWDGRINGTVSATLNGQNYNATVPEGQVSNVYRAVKNSNGEITSYQKQRADNGRYSLRPGVDYYVEINNASFNFGLGNANLTNQVMYSSSNQVQFMNANGNVLNKLTVSTDQNGTLTSPIRMLVKVTPTDVTDSRVVSFYDKTTGSEVPSGSLSLTAGAQHQLTVASVLGAAQTKYAAHQLENGNGVHYTNATITTTVKDLTDQLTKAGITVDANGNFKAPASFSFNLDAKSNINGATAQLPVTVNVANAAQTPAAQETTKTVKIMHIATIYDKNGKATHEPALRAYNTVSVVSDPVSLKDEKGNDAGKFYKLAGKDQYIKVGNVDGTSRSLKHNSYVYKSTGKRRGKTVLKKGSSVTTYGKSFMIAGHQMYRIGENQYVKKANF